MNQWILYYSPYLLPENNYKVDSLSTYLSGLTSKTISGGQYIRHELNLMLKVNVSQAKLEKDEDFTYNYISIQNDNGEIYYYFIISKKWISSDTIALVLKMDSLNTFAIGTNYSFTDRTKIIREHKNRFLKNKTNHTFTGTTGNTPESTQWGELYRGDDSYYFPEFIGTTISVSLEEAHHTYTWNIATGLLELHIFSSNPGESFSENVVVSATNPKRVVDLYSEGITPVLYGEDIEEIQSDGFDWFLIFKGEEGQGIDNLLCASESIVASSKTSATITPSDLTAGKWYYLYNGTFKDGDTIYKADSKESGGASVIEYRKDGTDIKYRVKKYLINSFNYLGAVITSSSIELNVKEGTAHYEYYECVNEADSITEMKTGSYHSVTPTTTDNIIYGYNSVSKIETDLLKIIKLPYCPIRYYKSGSKFVFGLGVSYDSTTHLLKLSSNYGSYQNEITPSNNPLHFLNDVDFTEATSETGKSSNYESKLYHSDFFQPKFVYDSFSYVVQLERFDISKNSYSFNITFVQTSTPNSRFLFSFNNYVCANTCAEDYYQIMAVIRNNEMPIYTSAYVSYMKTGYNYDVKSKNRNQFANIFNTVARTGGAVASFATGNPLGIMAGVSMMTSLVGTVNSVASSEQSIEQKLAQTKAQSGSIQSSDDVDLMSFYTNNRLKYMIYKVSEKMNKALFDLFYYTGYVANYQGIPNYTSRMWFNFIQCEAVLKDVKNIPLDCLNDIIERYKAGATFMHRHNGKYDWNREFENWETVLTIPNP